MIDSLKQKTQNENVIVSCANGTVCDISECEDRVFSSRQLGNGVLIRSNGNIVYSPVSGTVITIVEPTKHALIIEARDKTKFMIHVGIDTVNLGGRVFFPLIRKGAHVNEGQPLLLYNNRKIKRSNCSSDIMLIALDDEVAPDATFIPAETAKAGKTIIGFWK